MTYEQAKERRGQLEVEYQRAARALRELSGGGPLGLTPERVRATEEWQAAKRGANDSFAALQAFNTLYTRRYRKEIAQERR